MDLRDEHILNLDADYFDDRFYNTHIGKHIADYHELGLELGFSSSELKIMRKNFPTGNPGFAQQLVSDVLAEFRERVNNKKEKRKLKDLHVALENIQRGRLAIGLVTEARKEIEKSESVKEVLEMYEAEQLPDVPTNDPEQMQQEMPLVATSTSQAVERATDTRDDRVKAFK